MKHRLGLIVVALCLSAALISGCATVQKNEGAVAGGVVGAVAAHALTGGASTAWRAAATVGGAVAGFFAGKKLIDEKKK